MANRYWVEDVGNNASSGLWNDTNHWSTSSGGAGGASVPGTSDTAIFDSNSFLQEDYSQAVVYLDSDVEVATLNVTGLQTRRPLFVPTTVDLGGQVALHLTRTITAGSVSLSDCDFMNIIGAGAASWSGTRLGDCGGNSGITFGASRSLFWIPTGVGQVYAVSISAGGSGYVNGQTLTLSGGGTISCLVRITGVTAGAVTGISLSLGNQRGNGYSTGVVATTGGGGTGCTISIDQIIGLYNDTGRWSLSSGGAAANTIPLPQDDATFDANSFTPTDNLLTTRPSKTNDATYTRHLGRNVDFSAATNSPTFYTFYGNQSDFLYSAIWGDFRLNSDVTLAIIQINGAPGYSMWGSSDAIIDQNGATVVGVGLEIVKYGGSITLESNFSTGFNVNDYPASSMVAGTFDANGFDVLMGEIYFDFWIVADDETINRDYEKNVIMGSGTWSAWYFGYFQEEITEYEGNFFIDGGTSTFVNMDNDATYDLWLIIPKNCGSFYNIVMNRYASTSAPFFAYGFPVCQNLTILNTVVEEFPIDFESDYGSGIPFGKFTINGTLTITGVEGGEIYVGYGNIAAANTNISYVAVEINNALGNVPFQAVPGGIDLGGNTNWCFPGTCGNYIDYNPSLITAISKIKQDLPFPQFIMAGRGGAAGTDYVLFKKTTEYGISIWRSKVYKIGHEFDIKTITFNMLSPIRSGTELIPVLRFDSEERSQHAPSINSTNYPSGDKFIELTAKNFQNKVHGYDNFFFELQSTGAELATVALPIFIEIEVYD